jgi:hypothetical protein
MSLTAKERRAMNEQGRCAALARVGAFTCPYMDDEERFAAWIEGYERGEEELDSPSAGDVSSGGFWSEIHPLNRRSTAE